MKSLTYTFILIFLSFAAGAAEQTINSAQLPPWMQPAVIRLAMAIELRPEQVQEFRGETGAFIESYYSMLKKELRRNSLEKKRTIRRRTRKLAGKLDKSVAEILDEEQMPAYEAYRDGLVVSLSTPRKRQVETQASADLIQSH